MAVKTKDMISHLFDCLDLMFPFFSHVGIPLLSGGLKPKAESLFSLSRVNFVFLALEYFLTMYLKLAICYLLTMALHRMEDTLIVTHMFSLIVKHCTPNVHILFNYH